MIVSLEAVPRSREALAETVKAAGDFPIIRIINVADLVRFKIRSWEACGILGELCPAPGFTCMPHLRARDFDPEKPFPHTAFFRRLGIDRALVIAGDAEETADGASLYGARAAGPETWKTPTIPFIKKLKIEMPELSVYAAFDPYRSNIRYELDYLHAKEEAGAAGFFSQPFFDLRLLEIYAEYLEGRDVYWGISPVLSGKNRNYWESRNRAIFPKSFRPDLFWNVDFGRRVLDFCEKRGFNLYLMPIKVDLKPYLSGLLGKE
ncbi:MAG: methylenetetrahydrofolate reductase [Treponema sp.]|jgi:methylenetetrahydrofolate reductase (NADPH)|nr:methylenetetrahydrofolate reductase [Treponema sp.]